MKIVRMLIFFFGLILCALGAVLCTRPDLGTSSIACIPYVLTFVTPLSFGLLTFLLNVVFLLGQILILRKEFHWIQITQLAAAFVLGVFIDLFMKLTDSCIPQTYFMRVNWVIAGSIVTAFGIALQLIGNLIYLPGDGFVATVTSHWPIKFGGFKIAFDLTLILIAVIIILTAHLDFSSVREGTLISAILVGFCLRLLDRPIKQIKLRLSRQF